MNVAKGANVALPKRRHSTGRKGKRRAAIKLKTPTLIICPVCGQHKKPHRACPNCGSYKDREVVKQRDKQAKKKKK